MKLQVYSNHYLKSYDSFERFTSYWKQIELILKYKPLSVCEVGKGNGLFSFYVNSVLKISCETVDIDSSLNPTHLCSINDLRKLGKNRFEAVTAFQVLEHLPFSSLSSSLENLLFISKKYLFISLPHSGYPVEFYMKFLKNNFLSFSFRLPKKPIKWRLEKEGFGQHHWEIGVKNCSLRSLRKVLRQKGVLVEEFPNPFWSWHRFFVIKKF